MSGDEQTIELHTLSSEKQQHSTHPNDLGSNEASPPKRRRSILKASDPSALGETPDVRLVKFRLAESESDVTGEIVPIGNLEAITTESNDQIVRIRCVVFISINSCGFFKFEPNLSYLT